MYQYLEREGKKDGARLNARTRGKGQNLKHKRHCLNIWKQLIVSVTEHRHRLPREVVRFPPWTYSKVDGHRHRQPTLTVSA